MYTKAVRKRLRDLVAMAYEKELSLEMEKLAGQFKLWQEGKIDVWDLEEAVHKFHNGPARKLYNRYNDVSPEVIVPYAVVRGLVSFDDIPQEIAEEMRFKIKFFKEEADI